MWKIENNQIVNSSKYSSQEEIKQWEFVRNDSKILLCRDLDEHKYQIEVSIDQIILGK